MANDVLEKEKGPNYGAQFKLKPQIIVFCNTYSVFSASFSLFLELRS